MEYSVFRYQCIYILDLLAGVMHEAGYVYSIWSI